MLRDAIGIDPDSKGCQCALVKLGECQAQQRGYPATEEGMEGFIRWVKGKEDVIVAIEGSNGQSKPIEKALRYAEIVFYSFKPSDVGKFRKVVLGQNKNNKKDAESTARYAMALEAQGKLDKCKRVWSPDEDLQGLTRSYSQKTTESTRSINRLWKLLREASADLYLALGGEHPDIDITENILQNEGIMALLVEKPDIFEWKTLSETDFLSVMGNFNYKGRKKLIEELQKVSRSFRPVSPAISLMIKNTTEQILLLKRQLKEIKKMIEKQTKDNKAVKTLEQHRGIGTMTAATLYAEIIDIRRFVKDDNLASYSGLCKREYKTGKNEKEIPNYFFNRRLKNVFMTAARNYVLFNPGSHLAGYYRNNVKGGMKKTDARKRVARALVRVFFKELYSLVEQDNNSDKIEDKKMGKENDMANGLSRSDKYHSNISFPSPIKNNTEGREKVKREKTEKLVMK
ncbi:MAG: IS110 family transposase [Spirochaetes bacterium]|nr:IS110 family transposase [Spirochaetota bacterium]